MEEKGSLGTQSEEHMADSPVKQRAPRQGLSSGSRQSTAVELEVRTEVSSDADYL